MRTEGDEDDAREHADEEERHLQRQDSPGLLLGREWTVGRHEVKVLESDVVGFGGCACTIRGVYKGRPVAVKMLTRDQLTRTAVQLLEREASIWSCVSRPRHPNIVRFLGACFSSYGGTPQSPLAYSPLLLTELLDSDLRQLCESTRLHENSMLGIFVDIAYGLCYLHEQPQPIVHRDINPSNIFMKSLSPGLPNGESTVWWRAKIGDFGSATAGNTVSLGGGTELYSAPETLPSTESEQTQVITVKADIFSYGVLLLEVAMGELVPEDKCYRRLVERLGSKWPLLQSLVEQCTQYSPQKRPSACQVLDTLEQKH